MTDFSQLLKQFYGIANECMWKRKSNWGFARGVCYRFMGEWLGWKCDKDTKIDCDASTRVYRCIICLPRPTAHHFRLPMVRHAAASDAGGFRSPGFPAHSRQPVQRRHETFRGVFRVRCFMKHRSNRSVRGSSIVKEPKRWKSTISYLITCELMFCWQKSSEFSRILQDPPQCGFAPPRAAGHPAMQSLPIRRRSMTGCP